MSAITGQNRHPRRGSDTLPRTGRATLLERRILALAGVIGPVAFALVVVVAGLAWPGYRHRTQNISDLGGTEAPYPVVQNLGFVVLGLSVVALAIGLRRSRIGSRGAGAGCLLIGFFGGTLIVQALTPCTPGCQEGTVADVLHGLAATAGFLAFVGATWLLRRRMRSEPDWATYGSYTASTGIVTLVFLGAWLVAGALDPDGLHAGALQRSSVAAVLVWLAATGTRLLRPAREEAGRAR